MRDNKAILIRAVEAIEHSNFKDFDKELILAIQLLNLARYNASLQTETKT